MSLLAYGVTRGGRAARVARLAWPGGLEAEVLEFGAILRTLSFPLRGGERRNAILSLEDLPAYEADDRYIGQCLGRVANRIAGGRFPLDGRQVAVSVNEPPNTLHGGELGFGQRLWRFMEDACDDRRAVLSYLSPAGEEGFPGALSVRCTFELVQHDVLEIAYSATTDAPTPVNLSHHLYFNLLDDFHTTVLDHTLEVQAGAITPVAKGLIPTGDVAPVAGGPFDLRRASRLVDVLAHGGEQMRLAGGLDFNWVLGEGAAPAVTLTAPGGARLELETDQPGLQVYSGHKLTPPFVPHGALALEPQGFPDAVNHLAFPSQLLRPGQTYRRAIRYRLSAG